MAETKSSADSALEIMRDWQWIRCNPDGERFHPGRILSEVLNRLAMEGIKNPDDAVLTLLRRGDLSAHSDYQWRKYQAGRYYQLEGSEAPIKKERWQALADARSTFYLSDDFRPEQQVLKELGLGDCDAYDWQPLENRFCLAIQTPNPQFPDMNSTEEWYSVWDIEVWPRFADLYQDDELDSHIDARESSPPPTNKGGRPPIADWEAGALEMAGRHYRGDLKPNTIADVSRELAAWLAEQDIHPSESVLRAHSKAIFAAFQAWAQD